LAPPAGLNGIRFFSLQKGAAARESARAPAGMDLTDLGVHIRDFADTAAILAGLDLVITVDTAVAHLAGALGRPVWILVAKPSDWRWLLDREDSPWYPTARLFRQSEPDDWQPVLTRLFDALAAVTAG
jgi:ADP-heptose:LPS heptosyltransferase